MAKKPVEPSTVEFVFIQTPDGLVVDRVILRPACADAERDLRRFLSRFHDSAIDLDLHVLWERMSRDG